MACRNEIQLPPTHPEEISVTIERERRRREREAEEKERGEEFWDSFPFWFPGALTAVVVIVAMVVGFCSDASWQEILKALIILAACIFWWKWIVGILIVLLGVVFAFG